MKNYLQLIFLLSSINLAAQNYLPVPEGQTTYFQTAFFNSGFDNNECETGDCLLGIEVVEMEVDGDVTRYHFNEGVRGQNEFCKSDSWLGPLVEVTPNGEHYYANQNGKPILLKPFEAEGTSWVMMNLQSDLFIEATLIERYEEEILGTMDSVVNIELVMKDTSGMIVDSEVNFKNIRIAKTLGFVETLDLFNFPDYPTPIYLSGYRNAEVHGTVPPTAREIFDYEPGYEFHFRMHNFSFYPPDIYNLEGFRKIEILDKEISANEDTLRYQVARVIYWDGTVSDPNTSYAIEDTVELQIILSQYKFLDAIPYSPVDDNLLYSGYTKPFLDSNGAPIVRTFTAYYYDASYECFFHYVGTVSSIDIDYAKCLGRIKVGGNNEEEIVYYKKGAIEWGTPIDFDLLLPVREPLLAKETFDVFPNPAATSFSLSSERFINQEIKIKIFSLDGQLVKYEKSSFNGNLEIGTQNLNPGLYILKVITPDGAFSEKLLISGK